MTYDPHKNKTEIRQASSRRMNLRALLITGTVVVLAFILIYFVFFAGQGTVTSPTGVEEPVVEDTPLTEDPAVPDAADDPVLEEPAG